jgi:hypothetical protein
LHVRVPTALDNSSKLPENELEGVDKSESSVQVRNHKPPVDLSPRGLLTNETSALYLFLAPPPADEKVALGAGPR